VPDVGVCMCVGHRLIASSVTSECCEWHLSHPAGRWVHWTAYLEVVTPAREITTHFWLF